MIWVGTLQLSPAVPSQDLNTLFKEVIPDLRPEMGRMLVAHIAKTANVSASDPGLPVSEIQRALGVSPAVRDT